MSVMIGRVLFSLLWLIVFIVAPARAQDSPVPSHLKDSIFLRVPHAPMQVQGRNELTLRFDYDYDRCRSYYGDNYYRGCFRRLGLSGQRAESGISLTPPVPGEWRWQDDYTLIFTPDNYWQAQSNYTIDIDLDEMEVPGSVILGLNQRKIMIPFQTQPVTVEIPEMNYMQDPDDPVRKLVSARLQLNYPVEPAKLEEKIRLEMEEESGGKLTVSDDEPTYEIQHDSGAMTAWLSVPFKNLPDKDHYMRLIVDPGLAPQHGGQNSAQSFTERARIPTLESHLTISDEGAAIARAEDGTPQQILSFETNVKARPEDVRAKTKLYLLPEQHPVMKRAKDNEEEIYQWKAANEVTPEILKQAEEVTLQPMPDASDYATRFGFPFTAPAGRYLYMVAGEGMGAFGGYRLGRRQEYILEIPAWPNDIEIMQEGSILTLSGARKLSLHARGTDRLQLEVAHIRTEALQHFISQTEGDIRSPAFRGWTFEKEDMAQLDIKDLPMNYQTPQDSQYATFDFAPYLKDGRKGLFLLNVQGYLKDEPAGYAEQRFVLVTNMGLLVKQGSDGSREIFLVSFTTGQPVDGAAVSVLSRNGLSVFDGKTDAQGHLALPDISAATRDREPVAIVAQKDGDYTFIPYDRADRVLNVSQFDVGGAMTAAEGMNAFLFSDRGIYRPGEVVHIGALVRNADWTLLPPGLPLQMIVTDPRGRTVTDTLLEFPAQGMQELSLATEDNWPTGTYYARLHIADDGYAGNLLGSTSFRVEEFQPDRLRIQTAFAAESRGWVKPEGLEATVVLTNLYGTPATDRRITASVTLNPAEMKFDTYGDYRFYDWHAAKPRTVQYNLPDARTDAQGKAMLPLNLDRQEPATYSLNLETRGYESGSGRGVTSYGTLMVSPMDYVVGYTTDANTGYLKKGQDYSVDLLAIDPDLQPVTVSGLSLELVRRTFVSTLVKRSDGSYAYESVPREETVKTEVFKIPDAGAVLNLPTETIGSFSWRLKNGDGLTVADIPFSIAGEGQRTGGTDREAVLNLSINKQSYEPGEKIEMSITVPYTGAGLITLESDHVIAHKWFRTDRTDTIQTIPVPEDFSGKGYVSVSFVRDINSREIYLKPLSHAVVPFTANTAARTAKIELNVPAIVKPGETVTVSYLGNAKGKAIIYAVDEGVLQVARYETPDPVNFFLLSRALQVRTFQMLDLLMPEYDLVRELSAAGGDAEAQSAALGRHLNPFKRKTLAPAVFWTGIVDLDTTENTVTFTPPGHFNGEMRIMAIAVTDSGVGSAEQSITVQGDIIVTPNTPLFLAPGDEAEVSVTIANNVRGSGENASIALTVTPDAGAAVHGTPETLTIPEGEERTVTFKLQAGSMPGPAELSVHAALGDTVQESKATYSIRPPVPLETTLTAGYAEKGKAEIALTRKLYSEPAERQATLSSLPTSYIYGLLRYLDEFPYGCTEQIISKAFPQMSLYSVPQFEIGEKTMAENVWETVAILRLRQTPEGAFPQWDGGYDPHDFITVYALDFLIRAQEESLPVPADLIENGLRYLRDWVNQDVKSMEDARQKAYGIYVLTRSGIVTTNEILHLLQYYEVNKNTDWKTDLSAAYIASAYRMMQQSALAEQTMAEFQKGAFSDRMTYRATDWDSEWHNPFVKYAQYVSLLARHFPERMKNLDRNVVFTLATFIQEQRYSTISSSYAIQALQDYAASEEAGIEPAKLDIKIDGKKINIDAASFSIPVSAGKLEFKGGHRPVFFTLTETGFDRDLPPEPVAQNIEIDRRYLKSDGTPVSEPVNLGEVIESVITLRAYNDRIIDNVAIVDLLPGGFEFEPDGAGAANLQSVDRREDRLIAFVRATPTEQVFRFHMRAVTKGKFIAPPPFAEAMYDPTTKARGIAGEIIVADPQ